MFQNLRQGNPLYVIDKTGVPSLRIGQVVSVGNPTPVYNTQTAGLTMGLQTKMEVLVRAKVEDKEGDFPNLPADQSTHDYGNMFVTDSREAALSEVDSIKQRAQSVIDSVPLNEKTLSSCEEMSKTLNPNYAKEKERDEAIIFAYSVNASDLDDIASWLEALGCGEDEITRACNVVMRPNGGFTYSNSDLRMSVMCIGNATSDEQWWDTLIHEIKHAESHISAYYGVEENSEEASYLIGYIARLVIRALKSD